MPFGIGRKKSPKKVDRAAAEKEEGRQVEEAVQTPSRLTSRAQAGGIGNEYTPLRWMQACEPRGLQER